MDPPGPRNPDTKSDNRAENGARAIVTNAEIVAITVDEGVLGANGKATVQLWVKEEALTDLVKESNSDSKISLIPRHLRGGPVNIPRHPLRR